jgi:hypothetical protein
MAVEKPPPPIEQFGSRCLTSRQYVVDRLSRDVELAKALRYGLVENRKHAVSFSEQFI